MLLVPERTQHLDVQAIIGGFSGDVSDNGTVLALGQVCSSDGGNWECCVWANSSFVIPSCTLKPLKQPSAECLPVPSIY